MGNEFLTREPEHNEEKTVQLLNGAWINEYSYVKG